MAKLALEHMQHWATWLAALQSGALAAFGSMLLHRKEENRPPFTDGQLMLATGTVIFLGASILAATYVLGCLPSVALRLQLGTEIANDIYEASIFGFIEAWKIRLGLLTTLEHLFALMGMICLGRFVFSCFLAKRE